MLRIAILSATLLSTSAWHLAAQAAPGWRTSGENAAFALDSTVVRSGRASLRSDAGAGGMVSVRQGIKPDEYRGKRVRLSGYLRAEDVAEYAGLWMRVDGEEVGQTLSFDNMSTRPIMGTSDWQRYQIVLDVPATASYIIFGLLMVGKGRVWADDFSLEVVGLDVSSTSTVTASTEAAHGHTVTEAQKAAALAARIAAPPKPVNLDFEGVKQF